MAQIIRFTLVDFRGDWNAKFHPASSNTIQYTAGTNAEISVVVEGPTGTVTTYHYQIKEKLVAYVFNDVIHVPARCVSQDRGNTVRCTNQN